VHDLHRSDIQFVCVGGGDLQAKLMAMSQQMRLDEFVRFTGRIPDHEVIGLLSTADLCVAPDPKDALNDVSTMNKIIEYMALGKALVAFDLREARVSAGDAAVYATPNDHVEFAQRIVELLAAPERRQAMGAAGRQRFESVLAWEHQQKNLLQLYRDLVGEPA
jgi:glycosyltransferase involved in cell wall biosynthesis